MQVAVTLYRIIEWPEQFSRFLEVLKSIVKVSPAFVVLECSLREAPGLPVSIQNALIEISIPFLIWVAAVPIWVAIWLWQYRSSRGVPAPLSRYRHDCHWSLVGKDTKQLFVCLLQGSRTCRSCEHAEQESLARKDTESLSNLHQSLLTFTPQENVLKVSGNEHGMSSSRCLDDENDIILLTIQSGDLLQSPPSTTKV